MVKLKLTYYEIANEDFTAIDATIAVNDKVVAHYRNYNPTKCGELWDNQEETFMLPSVEVGRQMYDMNLNYTLVKG